MKRKVATLSFLILLIAMFLHSATARAFTTVTATNLTLTVSPGKTTITLQGTVSDNSTATYQINGAGCSGCTAPSHGTISYFNPATGTLVYQPSSSSVTADSFTFTVTANSVTSSQGTVSIAVVSTRTTIAAHLLNPDSTPRTGTVTFIPVQSAVSPDGLVTASSSVTVNLDSNGMFTVSLYPTSGLNPQTYYTVLHTNGNGTRETIGLYSVPPSSTTVFDSGWNSALVTDTNLQKRFIFASQSAVEALASAVDGAVTAVASSAAIAVSAAAVAHNYDLSPFLNGVTTPNQLIWKIKATRAFSLVITGSQCSAETAATAQTDFLITVNGVTKGTLRFAASGTTCTVQSATPTSIAIGDVIRLIGPATPDATLAFVSFTIFANQP